MLVHQFYRYKALIILEQVISLVVEKKNEQNFEVYWKTRIQDRGSWIRDPGSVKKKLEIK